MTFRVGQKVVCVDAGPHACLTNGAVYTVFRVVEQGVALVEIPSRRAGGGYHGYFFRRFRPVQEKKTDISIFHEILRKVSRKHKERA